MASSPRNTCAQLSLTDCIVCVWAYFLISDSSSGILASSGAWQKGDRPVLSVLSVDRCIQEPLPDRLLGRDVVDTSTGVPSPPSAAIASQEWLKGTNSQAMFSYFTWWLRVWLFASAPRRLARKRQPRLSYLGTESTAGRRASPRKPHAPEGCVCAHGWRRRNTATKPLFRKVNKSVMKVSSRIL